MYLYYFNFFLLILLFLVIGTWIFMIYLWVRSIRYSPKLNEKKHSSLYPRPKVSIIIPARNEEKNIRKCIDSLLNQNYPNFELILINDRSTDNTLSIVKQESLKDDRLKVIDIKSIPAGWVGNNWALYQGYLIATGDLLLFTDADTYHMNDSIGICVEYLIENDLDTLNLLPNILAHSLFTKLILPMYSLDRHTFCSPVDTNDPKKKAVYFHGIYFMIKRDVYEKIGTHASFKDKYSADVFIGNKLKELKFKINRVRGEFNLSTTLRSVKYVFNQSSRIMHRSYQESKLAAIRNTLSLLVVEFSPLVFLAYSIFVTQFNDSKLFPETVLLIISISTILVMIILCSLQSRFALYQSALYGFGAPIAGCIFSCAYAVGLFKAIGKASVNWRQ